MLKKLNAYALLFYGTISFMILTALAMLAYPGGRYHQHDSDGYSFSSNFFSDLGRYKTFLGEDKYISLFLFCVAIFSLALITVNFVFQFLKDITPNAYNQIKNITRVSTILFAVLLCGVALTPYDRLFVWHAFTSKACFLMMLPMCISMSYLVYKDKILHNKYSVFMALVSIALFIYVYILFFGPSVASSPHFQPVAQKIIVYLLIFALMYLSIGCKKYFR